MIDGYNNVLKMDIRIVSLKMVLSYDRRIQINVLWCMNGCKDSFMIDECGDIN